MESIPPKIRNNGSIDMKVARMTRDFVLDCKMVHVTSDSNGLYVGLPVNGGVYKRGTHYFPAKTEKSFEGIKLADLSAVIKKMDEIRGGRFPLEVDDFIFDYSDPHLFQI